jgi:hypothetical protein
MPAKQRPKGRLKYQLQAKQPANRVIGPQDRREAAHLYRAKAQAASDPRQRQRNANLAEVFEALANA